MTTPRIAFIYDGNQDHSMLTGRAAAANVVGGREDPWLVNGDDAYLGTAQFEPGVRS